MISQFGLGKGLRVPDVNYFLLMSGGYYSLLIKCFPRNESMAVNLIFQNYYRNCFRYSKQLAKLPVAIGMIISLLILTSVCTVISFNFYKLPDFTEPTKVSMGLPALHILRSFRKVTSAVLYKNT